MQNLPADGGKYLLRALLNSAALMGQPVSGTFELTSRCNLECGMCYIRKPASDALARGQELSSAEWIALAREAVDNGMVFLLLTGGEALLRPDYFDIYEPLTTLGIRITLFSNGTLITPEIARRIADRPPSRIEITLYGACRETYEATTGVIGSYERCLSGIENLLSAGIKPVMKTTITRLNVGELGSIQRMAREWNLPIYAGWLLSPRRDGACGEVDRFRTSVSESVALEEAYPDVSNQQASTPENSYAESNASAFYCNAGKNLFVIGPSGEMNVCIDLPLPAARPLECGFKNAWQQVRAFVESVPPAQVCSSCNLQVHCPWCPAWSHVERGNLTDPVPYLCEIAKERRLHHDKRTVS